LTPFETQLWQLIEPRATELGFELVRLAYGGDKRKKLQVMAERADGTMNVEDCAALSRGVSELLDQTDPIAEEYVLEVSSPGIDRPLTRPKDYERWAGFDAKLEAAVGVNGQRRFSGTLLGLADGQVSIRTQTGEFQLPLADVVKAKLLLTDALINAARPQTLPLN
jgi:ribosome maturation factor RimP